MPIARIMLAALFLSLAMGGAMAGQNSLFHTGPLAGPRASLFAPENPQATSTDRSASLFRGQVGTGLFAPWPDRPVTPDRPQAKPPAPVPSRTAQVLHLIALAEAGPLGYDAVQHGATRRPPDRPTRMTIAQIYDWIDRTPGQHHAIGRYQFIPKTLRRLVTRLKIPADQVFTPAIQDRLAILLLEEAGLRAFHKGKIGRHALMHNMAKVWAGLPTASGLSYYHGKAGNRATMTWTRFDAEMRVIFPG